MTQGNPYGRTGGPWMLETKLRALASAGLTYDEIAEINERSEGWKPHRSVVKRKLESMGITRRRTHRELIPWKVRPEHNNSVLRHMLQAESRSRQGAELSDTDRKLVDRLHELLFGRGKLMVVGYHPDVGFYTTPRADFDNDIIRQPRADQYADPGIEGASASSRVPAPQPQTRASSSRAAESARMRPCDTG